MQRTSNKSYRGTMITKLQIEKKGAEIFRDLWSDSGAPADMIFGRTRNGIVDILLEFDDTRRDEVEALIAEAHNKYVEQLP